MIRTYKVIGHCATNTEIWNSQPQLLYIGQTTKEQWQSLT